MTTEQPGFRLRSIAYVAYGPATVSSIANGAVMPIVALRARDLGASVSTAAFVVALLGIGQLCFSLPAGALVARVGERRTLVACGCIDACVMTATFFSHSVALLGAAVFVSGTTWTAFLLARQGYLIEAVPVSHRARAMSGLGAAQRVGILVGPLLGALVIHLTALRGVFLLSACFSVLSATMAARMPDFGRTRRGTEPVAGVWSVLREHRRVLLTLGLGVVVIAASRSVRNGLLPLWANHIGLSASTTSLLFAFAAGLDIVLTVPGGHLLDRRGRMFVAIPVVLAVGVGCLLLPLAHDAVAVAGVMAIISVGNGLGAGIVMTLGADNAPHRARSQFLGGWRLCGDIGTTGGPLMVGAIAGFAPVAVASLAIGIFALVGTVWVGYWTRQDDLRRQRALTTTAP